MKAIRSLLVLFFVLFISTAQADGEFTGPAFRAYHPGCSVSFGEGWLYGADESFIQYSNGKTGHATFKCKVDLLWGEPAIYYSEFATDGWPVPGGPCFNTFSIEGKKGMWTAQCFDAEIIVD